MSMNIVRLVHPKQAFKLKIVLPGSVTMYLPLVASSPTFTANYNFTVDWGDGSSIDTVTTYNGGSHTYADGGTYYITMAGTCNAFNCAGGYQHAVMQAYLTSIEDIVDLGFTNELNGRTNFTGCTNLTHVAKSFNRLRHLVSYHNMFEDCTSLATIPDGMFDGSIVSGSGNDFLGVFSGCTSLASIPANLFDLQTTAVEFTAMFSGCTALTTVPTDIFRYCTSAQVMDIMFYGCSSLTTVPTNLFKYNTACTDFNTTFMNCTKLQQNANIFYANGEQSTRFLNKTVDFTQCFYISTFSGSQGTAPDLWDCSFGTGTPTKSFCWGGAGNSATNLSNYASIPAAWK